MVDSLSYLLLQSIVSVGIITMLLLYFIRVYEDIRQHLIDDDGYTIATSTVV